MALGMGTVVYSFKNLWTQEREQKNSDQAMLTMSSQADLSLCISALV